MQKLQGLYESMIEDDSMMQELEEIIAYAANKMKHTITNGTEIYEFVETKLNIEPIGIMPLDHKEGYFFLCGGNAGNTHVYQYRIGIFEKHDEKYRSMVTDYIATWQRSIVNSHHNIKAELIRNRSFMSNPAVYAVETPLTFPLEETLLPIAKRSLVRYISMNAPIA